MNKLKSLTFAFVASLTIVAASLIPISIANADTPVWTTKAPMPRTSAFGGTAIGPDGKIYELAGIAGRDETTQTAITYPEMYIYTPSTNTWVTKTVPFVAEQGAIAFGGDGQLYVMGGSNDQDDVNIGFTNTTRAYNPATDTWTTRAPMPKLLESSAAATGANGKIYVFGGITYDPADTMYGQVPTIGDVNEYDPTTDTWTPKASDPVLRMQATSVLLNGKIYVIGGRSFTADPEPPYCVRDQCNTVEAYDPATNTWATKNNFPAYVSAMGAAVVNNELYVAGGRLPTGPTGDVYKYVPATDSWQLVTQLPTTRTALGVVASNNKLLTIGGLYIEAQNHVVYTDVVEELSFTQPDTTPPTITATKSPAANTNGWNNSNATVSFTCTDNVAVATCPGGSTVSANGAGQTVSGTATDTSGNTATASATVNLDKTIPTASAPTLSTTLIFFTGNLTITANASDQVGLSGIDKGLYYLDVNPASNPTAVGTNMTYSATTGKVTATKNIALGSLSVGTHTVYIRTLDKAGNLSAPVSVTFVYI